MRYVSYGFFKTAILCSKTVTSILDIAVAWEALFVYDIMIVTLTLLKTYKERFRFRRENRGDLVSLIVRDGK